MKYRQFLESRKRFRNTLLALVYGLSIIGLVFWATSCHPEEKTLGRIIAKAYHPQRMSNEPDRAVYATHMTPRVIIVPHINPPPPPHKVDEYWSVFAASIKDMRVQEIRVAKERYESLKIGDQIVY